MNFFSGLALISWFLVSIACKQTSDKDEQLPSQPGQGEAQEAQVQQIEKKPLATASDLKLSSVSLSIHRIGSNQSALVSLETSSELPEYFEFEFCSDEDPEACTKGWFHDTNFIVPGLEAGTYKFRVQACTRKEKAQSESCGEEMVRYYQQPENPDTELNYKILSFFSLLPQTQNISFEVFNALLDYKDKLSEAGHSAPQDDTETAIDNLLEIGPYQNSAYYLNDSFDTVRDSVLEQQAKPSDSLLLTADGEDKGQTRSRHEPTTLGKIMILGGFATVIAGFGVMPSTYQASPQDRLKSYRESLEKYPKQKVDVKRLRNLNQEIKKYPNPGDFRKGKVAALKRGAILVAAGFAIVIGGFGTLPNLTEVHQSVQSIRRSLLAKLESLETDLVKIIKQRKALAEEIPF